MGTIARTLMLLPGVTKSEAGHIATSTVGTIVGQLEAACGDVGLYSATEAECESYEFCMGIASDDKGDMIIKMFEIVLTNDHQSSDFLKGHTSVSTDVFYVSVERVVFLR